jgi:hypothetical protein
MHANWHVNRDQLCGDDRASFTSMDQVLAAPLEAVTRDSVSAVSRLVLQGTYYVKTFAGRKSRLRHLLGISRYQRELANLEYFRQLGLPTPSLVAHGERKRMGLLDQAVLVTAEVAEATDLLALVRAGEFYARGKDCAREMLSQLANATRLMHEDGFYHQDLKPRNVLARFSGDEPELFFFDCPRGRRPVFGFRRCVVKELAHIERDLRGEIRRADLMYLYRQYRGCERLSPDDKALAREALSYYATRRMNAERRGRLETQQQWEN